MASADNGNKRYLQEIELRQLRLFILTDSLRKSSDSLLEIGPLLVYC